MKIKHLYVFGPFRLNVTEKLFLRDEETLPLTPKAFETLLALVQKSGQLVAEGAPRTVIEQYMAVAASGKAVQVGQRQDRQKQS